MYYVTVYLAGVSPLHNQDISVIRKELFHACSSPHPFTHTESFISWMMLLVLNCKVKNIWEHGLTWRTQRTPKIFGVISKYLNSMRFIHPPCDYLFKALLVISKRRDLLKRPKHVSTWEFLWKGQLSENNCNEKWGEADFNSCIFAWWSILIH